MTVIHPFPDADIGFTFKQHRDHKPPYLGGDDYIVAPNEDVVSPCSGTAVRVSASEIEVRYNATTVFGLRELKTTEGSFPRRVRQGDVLGTTGRRVLRAGKWVTLWPHLDAEVNGVRERFGPHVTTAPAGGGGAPITDTKGNPVAIIVQHRDNGAAALVDPYTFRRLTTEAELAIEKRMWGGNPLQVSTAEWNLIATTRIAIVVPPAPGGGTVDLQPVLDGIDGVEAAIVDMRGALPAEVREKFRTDPLK